MVHRNPRSWPDKPVCEADHFIGVECAEQHAAGGYSCRKMIDRNDVEVWNAPRSLSEALRPMRISSIGPQYHGSLSADSAAAFIADGPVQYKTLPERTPVCLPFSTATAPFTKT
jgi:hypothetical protein